MKDLLKYKNVLCAAIIILVAAVVNYKIYDYYRMQTVEIEKMKKELEENRETLELWKQVKPAYEKLRVTFFRDDVLEFKKYVESVANMSGINITDLKFSHELEGFYWKAKINLNAVCFYEDFVEFAGELGKRSIEIKEVSCKNLHRRDLEKFRSMGNMKLGMTLTGIVVE